ncbi:Fcf2 pre-rRNA processing-domain-containing protein [Endogone sp. FLAS-F59071]|nr:Fcf2 pre-rRNA processing-domain-containing protein [Endogone sp. FLAS-F59071]|eukprot:RUS18611.1 Fcf2 pre-rRNA processing-domain-containing protein [Endogone sp. FLAS-F59071]
MQTRKDTDYTPTNTPIKSGYSLRFTPARARTPTRSTTFRDRTNDMSPTPELEEKYDAPRMTLDDLQLRDQSLPLATAGMRIKVSTPSLESTTTMSEEGEEADDEAASTTIENGSEIHEDVDDDRVEEKEEEDEDLDALLIQAQQSLSLKKQNTITPVKENNTSIRLPKLESGLRVSDALYIQQNRQTGVAQIATSEVVLKGEENKNAAKPALQTLETKKNEEEEVKKLSKKERAELRAQTAGPGWFSMPRPNLTPELKRDLQLLKLRNVLDPKRHYKKDDSKGLPTYFQVGTIVEAPHEFYSSRLTRRERKSTIVDELAADSEARKYYKRKFLEIQEQKQAGGKGFYKKIKKDRMKPWEK